ncbi:hypothetical protein F4823DRAFT_579057 [Ustulina deusta]|nr:hypothetical protein F4823DRAFT_579057 [Ustulina deusta]
MSSFICRVIQAIPSGHSFRIQLGKHSKLLQAGDSILIQSPTVRYEFEFTERCRNNYLLQAHHTYIESFTKTRLKLDNGTMLDVDIVSPVQGKNAYLPLT